MTKPVVPIKKGHRTVAELAAFLGVTPRTIERWYADGKIPKPAHVDGRGWKFWSASQCREILQWHLKNKKRS